MASLYKHKKYGYQIHYKIYFCDGTCSKKYRYAASKSEADRICTRAEYLECGSRRGNLTRTELAAAMRDGLLSSDEAALVSGVRAVAEYNIDVILERYAATSSVAKTPYAHTVDMRRARNIAKWIKKNPIPTLTDSTVKKFILDRRSGRITYKNKATGVVKRGVSDKTIKNELEVMRALIDEAVKLGMLQSNVAREVDLQVKNKRLRRALSTAEVKRLIKSAEDNRRFLYGQAYEFVMTALFTGMRRSELRTLKWEDVNLKERLIYIQAKSIEGEDDFTTKSGEARSVGIPDRLHELLSNMKRNGPWVFGGKRPLYAGSLTQAFKKIVLRAGLDPSLSLHHTRHTYGSKLLKLTGDLRFVQDRMGHLDLETTKNYMHVIENENSPEKSFDYE